MKIWNKLTFQFALLVLFVLVITTTVSTLHHFYSGLFRLDERIHSEVDQFLELMSIPAGQAAYEIDRDLAESITEGLVESKYFDSAEIVTDFGDPLARSAETEQSDPMAEEVGMLFRRHVGERNIDTELRVDGDRTVGSLTVHVDTLRLFQDFRDSQRGTMIFNFFWNLLIVSLLTVCFFFWFLKPLLGIHASMLYILREDTREGEIPIPAAHSRDELGELAKTGGNVIHRFRRLLEESRDTRNRLARNLSEKEVLLQEIHHRVKNNLQIISSLLNLQRSEQDDDNAKRIFEEIESRVNSMALVHEQLYESGNLSSIGAQQYTEELVDSLRRIYDAETRVHLEFSLQEMGLELNTAILYGLILNELVSNAYKYGKPRYGQPRISLSLEQRDGWIVGRIQDNGPGLDDAELLHRSDTLGMQLISALVKQLQGKLEYFYREGAEFVFSFPAEHDIDEE